MQSNFGGSKCAGRLPICEGNSTVSYCHDRRLRQVNYNHKSVLNGTMVLLN